MITVNLLNKKMITKNKASIMTSNKVALIMAIVIISLFAARSQAALLEFIGPCEQKTVAAQLFADVNAEGKTMTVEAMTKLAAENRKIEHTLSKEGLFTFFDKKFNPTEVRQMDYVEVGFGWCYLVNGMPAKVSARDYYPQPNDRITWIHTFSLKINGEWDMSATCVPTYERYSELFCQ